MVPFVDIRRFHAPIQEALHAAALRVIDSGKFIGGPDLKAFEAEMQASLGGAGVCGVACATSGLFAILKCLGVGPGDEVITTVHTAIATAEAVSLTGAQVVFCDLQPGFFYLDPAQVRQKITPRTKAIIAVHLYGQPADLDALLAISAEHNLPLIEDCAQAQGARYRGRPVGTFGDAGVFSFFPSKTLGGFGDGGAVTARDAKLLRVIRMFSNHGREDKYLHEFEGINSRLDTLQAALLRVCLAQLPEWGRQRRQAAAWYREQLAGLAQVVLPQELPDTEPAYHLFVITVPDREALMAHLKKLGIETGIHYPLALNQQPAYRRLKQGTGAFPRAEEACRTMLSLPLFPGITEAEVKEVSQAIRAFYQS
jgi:dTDP-4-amino-4,6-dideoxygalactose transaminase